MKWVIPIKQQIEIDSINEHSIESFYARVTIILFKLSVYLLTPLLVIGSFFYYRDDLMVFAIIEFLVGILLVSLIYSAKPNITIKRNIILFLMYVTSLFVLITTGIAGGGFTSLMMATIFVALLSRTTNKYKYYLAMNFIVFLVLTILLYTGQLDNLWISTYKSTWPFLVVLVLVYTFAVVITIAFYKSSLETKYNQSYQALIHLDNIMNSVDEIVVAVDCKGIITFANDNANALVKQQSTLVGTLYKSNVDNLFQPYTSMDKEHAMIVQREQYYQARTQSGLRIFYRNCNNIEDKNNQIIGSVYTFQDVTERLQREQKLEYLSFHDQLTGLYNRSFFETELSRLDTKRNLPIVLVLIDVNGLKLINESFGHEVGDSILIQTANSIKSVCRKSEIIARIGGDEFIILLPQSSRDIATSMVKRIRMFTSINRINNIEISFSVGIGVKQNEKQKISDVYKHMEDELFESKLHEASSMRSKTIDLILQTLYEKNKRERNHSDRVSLYAQKLSKALGYDDDRCQRMRIAGLMHDIGKIGIEETILNKKGTLTEQEWKKIKQHPEIGYRILSSHSEFIDIAEHVRQHHERMDGMGYPQGLSANDISEEARIIAIADSYDAMTGFRTYRNTLSTEEAIIELQNSAGTQFDKKMVDVFIAKVILPNKTNNT